MFDHVDRLPQFSAKSRLKATAQKEKPDRVTMLQFICWQVTLSLVTVAKWSEKVISMQSKRTLISMEKHYLSEQRTDKAENLQMAAFSSHQHFKGERLPLYNIMRTVKAIHATFRSYVRGSGYSVIIIHWLRLCLHAQQTVYIWVTAKWWIWCLCAYSTFSYLI